MEGPFLNRAALALSHRSTRSPTKWAVLRRTSRQWGRRAMGTIEATICQPAR